MSSPEHNFGPPAQQWESIFDEKVLVMQRHPTNKIEGAGGEEE